MYIQIQLVYYIYITIFSLCTSIFNLCIAIFNLCILNQNLCLAAVANQVEVLSTWLWKWWETMSCHVMSCHDDRWEFDQIDMLLIITKSSFPSNWLVVKKMISIIKIIRWNSCWNYGNLVMFNFMKVALSGYLHCYQIHPHVPDINRRTLRVTSVVFEGKSENRFPGSPWLLPIFILTGFQQPFNQFWEYLSLESTGICHSCPMIV